MSERIESVRAAVAMIRSRMGEGLELAEAVAIEAALVAITATIDADTHTAAHAAINAAFDANKGLRSCPKRGMYGGVSALVEATDQLVTAAYHAMSERWAIVSAGGALAWVMIEIERHAVECAMAAA